MADTDNTSATPGLEHKRKFGEVRTAEEVKRVRTNFQSRLAQDLNVKSERLFEQEKQMKHQQRRIAELEGVVAEQENAIALVRDLTLTAKDDDATRDLVAKLSQTQTELEEAKATVQRLCDQSQIYELAISPPNEAARIAMETQAQTYLNLVQALKGEVAGRDAYIDQIEGGKARDSQYIRHLENDVACRTAEVRRHGNAAKTGDYPARLNKAPNQVAGEVVPLHKRNAGLIHENDCLKRGLLKRDAEIIELKQQLLAEGVRLDDANPEGLQRKLHGVCARVATTKGAGELTKLTPIQEAHVARRIKNEVRGARESLKKEATAEAKAEVSEELQRLQADVKKFRDLVKNEKKKAGDVARRISSEVRGARETTEKDIAQRILREVPHAHRLESRRGDNPASLTPTQHQLVQQLVNVSVETAKNRAEAAEAAVEELKARAHQSEALMKVLTASNEGLLQALEGAKATTVAVEGKLAAAEKRIQEE
ncbi:hypothetical protein Tdes44962_MAKER05349 [Teratosphaeria destructans]|uniref:Uncharacterized protein n=1 Tax=Teratosphaeria destructans TaxID=418781 RepID=A0A9W7VZ85_9PEZI|nr:hypothetical protein Tdes44962_MAKER05349 [Teratosphaeria destructans]